MCSVTGTTNFWLPLDWIFTRALSVSPGRSGTLGTVRVTWATRPFNFARLTSSQGWSLTAWA